MADSLSMNLNGVMFPQAFNNHMTTDKFRWQDAWSTEAMLLDASATAQGKMQDTQNAVNIASYTSTFTYVVTAQLGGIIVVDILNSIRAMEA